jgi:phosphatidylglycerophosphate synthase/putative flippase GtrA
MNLDFGHWLEGRLSGFERVLSAAGPVLFLLAYFGLAAIAYHALRLWRGPFRDEEMVLRTTGGFASRRVKHFFAWTMRPWWTLLARVGFPPNAITSLSFALALAAAVAVAAGRFALGGWLFVMAGSLDFLDGRVARSTGRTSPSGAALDSVLDRYVESALIAGLCWYYRQGWVLVPCLLALTGSMLVPYVRARGESLGVSLKEVGFMQRPERVLLLGAGTALSPILEVLVAPDDPRPPHRLAIATLVVLAITSHATALQRLYQLVRALGGGSDMAGSGMAGSGIAGSGIAQPLRVAAMQVLATLADFAVAGGLVYGLRGVPSLATMAGCVVGAVVSFVLTRMWAFDSHGPRLSQVGRYAFVSAGPAALNGGGVALLATLNAPFLLGWALTRAIVFVTWSYPLQRDFVFHSPHDMSAEAPVASRP